ncbi:hypothetical protein [Cohnella sp. REN36]|uniref:hypothetical protein n=1 Tax=Cohnella sp. REN36 TaxID=2887347 RepID=UPI001D14F2F9|nr:hypothetical protein [Cohnella sp. REN36]MCC3372931.1 hypothetical protein [Cohnella sp. REN36]
MNSTKNRITRTLLMLALSLTLLLPLGGMQVWASAASEPDAVTGAEPESHPGGHRHPGGGHGGHKMGLLRSEQLLSLLKTDAASLERALRAGQSLADVAKQKGVDKAKVVDLIVAQQAAKLDAAVQSGRLTADEAQRWRSDMKERAERIVEHKGLWGGKGHYKESRRLADTAAVLGITPEKLIEELKSGKTIAQLGKEKGLSEEVLVNRLLEKEKVRIQERIHRSWTPNAKRNA